MSRNLGSRECYFCGLEEVGCIEEARQITAKDCGCYFEEYAGLLVANADCGNCGAKYLAWVDDSATRYARKYGIRQAAPEEDFGARFFDLSFRSTFDDEYGIEDLPTVHEYRIGALLARFVPSRFCLDEKRYHERKVAALRDELNLHDGDEVLIDSDMGLIKTIRKVLDVLVAYPASSIQISVKSWYDEDPNAIAR